MFGKHRGRIRKLAYDQATQDGCSFADQHLLHLHPVHLTDLPTYLLPPQLMIALTLDQNIST